MSHASVAAGALRGVKVLEFVEFWNPDGYSDGKIVMKIEVGFLPAFPGGVRGVSGGVLGGSLAQDTFPPNWTPGERGVKVVKFLEFWSPEGQSAL